jgi:hypothetical protein
LAFDLIVDKRFIPFISIKAYKDGV